MDFRAKAHYIPFLPRSYQEEDPSKKT
nr:unnamed protein product [Callosobruchus analis]